MPGQPRLLSWTLSQRKQNKTTTETQVHKQSSKLMKQICVQEKIAVLSVHVELILPGGAAFSSASLSLTLFFPRLKYIYKGVALVLETPSLQ